jgi:hypothetical protein
VIDLVELVGLVAAAEAVSREQVAIVVRSGEVIVEAYRGAAAARAPVGADTMRTLARGLLASAETRVTAATDALAAAERDVAARREALDARRRTLARLTELAEMPVPNDTAPTTTTETQ